MTIMKKLLMLIAMLFLFAGSVFSADGGPSRWFSDKFSMFIHFGIYSKLGGVWDGKPVTSGYSEQIQSFAGIFSDWYGMTADEFDPVRFDADSIVSLAKDAGMRSIVFTTKHHDGFCMFRTETTRYNSYDATPCHRDFVKELSEACRKQGVNFGLYFSLIDWNYPYAYPISSHNADFVTPEHHEFSKRQVRELLTNYGKISELWFDMGSLTPEQSREMYELVHSLQPDCMVSGRVGNDYYDFAVMGDNKYPEGSLHAPWQSAASMFNETWSYRSWQERGEVSDKVEEKLRSLINVVSHGGNYLLNIGPDGDGAVIPFERDVLLGIGRWLQENGDAIYGTEASPFRESFAWGAVTRKGKNLYLILSGERPEDGKARLDLPGYEVVSSDAPYSIRDGVVTVELPEYTAGTPAVVRMVFDREIEDAGQTPLKARRGSVFGTWEAVADHSYSCFDYYSNFRSTVAYSWSVDLKSPSALYLRFTASEAGRKVNVEVDGEHYELTLDTLGKYYELPEKCLRTDSYRYKISRGSIFDSPSVCDIVTDYDEWTEAEACELISAELRPFGNCRIVMDIYSPDDRVALFDVESGNGVELFVNGVSRMKRLNPYRSADNETQVAVPLNKGMNQLLLRSYNRFEDHLPAGIAPSSDCRMFEVQIPVPGKLRSGVHVVTVSAADSDSPHKDSGLNNLALSIR